ncbi:hypothetical protein [Jeotgalibacillus terrae]|uniref:Lipoprotein n=1 Tax=Jeotgalibacillus terrae TaxID=587735 RepID=A0ABW5ZDI0_9BACL|nr:hypothetical protein [Jeotgalibacillus terrae]MBM7580557.1 PBP1b-binding outer membrane lipoprotein LpoB [Jeotgalibacillus terrae]
MKLICAFLIILFLAGCSKEPEPPEVSPDSGWIPAAMHQYDLAPDHESKKLPVL